MCYREISQNREGARSEGKVFGSLCCSSACQISRQCVHITPQPRWVEWDETSERILKLVPGVPTARQQCAIRLTHNSMVSCQKGPYPPCLRMADRALWQGTLELTEAVQTYPVTLNDLQPFVGLLLTLWAPSWPTRYIKPGLRSGNGWFLIHCVQIYF